MNNSSEDISLSLLANPQHIKKKDTTNIKKEITINGLFSSRNAFIN